MKIAILIASLIPLVGLVGQSEDAPQATVTVTGDSSPNRWSTPSDSSAKKPAKIGAVDGRMQVPVANGDIVAFNVNSGSHHVLFENAVTEQAANVWEVVQDTGSLEKLPAGQFPHYNHDDAMSSTGGTGPLIKIRIKNLKQGSAILFACRPHSESPSGANVPMLGALVGK